MSYKLKEVTVRTNNFPEGVKKIEELWKDVLSGKLPMLSGSNGNFQNNIFLISRYSNYESDENGNYDLSILAVSKDFFKNIELEIQKGKYKKYDIFNEVANRGCCTKLAWEKVWNDQKNGIIDRSYFIDYESNVPAKCSQDGKNHCLLYISVK